LRQHLPPHEVRRFSAANAIVCDTRRVPIAAIGTMPGISPKHFYAIVGAGVSADYCALLAPLIRDIESRKIAFRCPRAARRAEPTGDP
jgi:hypothetical protein